MKINEIRRIIRKMIKEQIIKEELYDTSKVNRNVLKTFLSKLDKAEIDYSFDGSNEELSFDVTELDRAGQLYVRKIFKEKN